MAELERHLATVLCADVKDYSRHMQSNEEATIRRLHQHRAIIDPLITEHGGRIANTAGDSVVAEFVSVVNAVKCAVTIQEQLKALGSSQLDESLSYRFGIHLGDVISKGADILGDSVNIAARIEGIAEAGGVCISKTVFDSIKGKSPYHFEDLGEQELKNIAQPVRVYKVIFQHPEAPKTASSLPADPGEKPSIAVLPLDNMSNDPEQEYFSDGLTEDIITDLSKVSGLIVIARNSTFTYKKQSVDLRKVGNELGVRYVLEGSVRKAGDRLRITVQLIEAANGSHVWAERYDRVLTDIFDLQDEITHTIVQALEVQLTQKESALIEKHDTKDTVAYELLMRGRQKYWLFTRDSVQEARGLFLQVIDRDPDYVLAYVLVAHTHIYDYIAGFVPFRMEYLELARPYFSKALELDPQSSPALAVMGWFAIWHKEQALGVSKLTEALTLEPNNTNVLNWLSFGYSAIGEGMRAIDLAERSLKLDPKNIVITQHALAVAYFSLGKLESCRLSASEALATNPNFLPSHVFCLAANFELNRLPEAQQSAEEIRRISPKFVLGMCNLFASGAACDRLDHSMASLGFSVPD